MNLQVAPILINRVYNLESHWQKDASRPKLSADFDFTLDIHSVQQAITQLNFVQLKSRHFSSFFNDWHEYNYLPFIASAD